MKPIFFTCLVCGVSYRDPGDLWICIRRHLAANVYRTPVA